MNKVEELCDRVLMMHRGETVLYGDVMETRTKFRRNSIRLNIDGEIGEIPGVIDRILSNGSLELVLGPDTTPQSILDWLRGQEVTINHFEVLTPSLNEIFLDHAAVDRE